MQAKSKKRSSERESEAALAGDDLEEIKKATEELTEIIQQLSVKLYEQAAQAARQGAEGAGSWRSSKRQRKCC